ncbi:MAG: GNAT family N-acetyltransferase [Thermomicrobiales bacterium]|nr:GNAT family N-acetyltransferase [Thermomicrobiales bacterium]
MERGLDPRVTIRDVARPGDLGWVIGRHGALYAAEYGWSMEFDLLVAGIATAFFQQHDSAREHCWFAEIDGCTVGCVFLVQASERVAKLRMLLVEPEARGLGVGRALVATCLDFARAAGYETVTLWTNSILVAARRLYETFGFQLVESEPYHGFGHDLISETWNLDLRG